MLCDELTAPEALAVYDHIEPIKQRIAKARKFILSADFSHAADGMVDNVAELERIVPFCRLPYQECWFEVAQNDRPSFVHGEIKAPTADASPPKRIGYLCTTVFPHDFRSWRTHLFWSFHKNAPICTPTYGFARHLNGSLVSMVYDTEFDAARYVRSELATVYKDAERLNRVSCAKEAEFGWERAQELIREGHLKTMLDFVSYDWGGEQRFILAMLGLLNTRNVVELKEVDNTEWNKKRAKQGRSLFFSHHVVKIAHTIRRRMIHAASEQERREGMRAHFVRGHFKQRQTGLFWWSPFVRGDLKKGFISKDYKAVA